jgi:hypothetical protein
MDMLLFTREKQDYVDHLSDRIVTSFLTELDGVLSGAAGLVFIIGGILAIMGQRH